VRLTRVKKNRSKVKQWDRAIRDAQSKLAMAKERVVRLAEIVADFEGMKAAREPWPGAGVQELDRKRQANG
jgi:hypothetical protein